MKILICFLMVVLVACGSAPTPDTTAPSTPQGLKATARNAAVNLEWIANTEPDLEHYVLRWGSSAAQQNAKETMSKTQTNFELTGLTNGTTYYFKLEASDTTGNTSSGSSLLSATPNTPDRTAPSVTSSVPNFNAIGVALDTQIQLTFSKAMNPSSLTTSSSNLALGAATWNATNTTVSFVTPPLQHDQTYTIVISGKDTAGNNLSGATSLQFSSLAAAPSVTGSTPANNAQSVAINSKIIVRFSKPMSKIAVETAFSSVPAIECQWLWTEGDKTATCTPNSNLRFQTPYDIGLSTLAKSKTGEALEHPFVLNFMTVPDKVKPALVSFTPTDSQTNVPINSAIVLNFNKAMNRASVESAFQSNPSISCTWTWTTDSSARCQPMLRLTQAATYTITLANHATDLSGNSLQTAYGFSFQVGNAPPFIADIRPRETFGVSKYAQIVIVFSEPMDTISTANAFGEVRSLNILNQPSTVPGSLSWNFDSTHLIFTPTNPLPDFSFITWTLSAAARDTTGTSLEQAASGSFQTQ
jgi:Bacterial Ig-like domain/Fibronectin type III domain